MSKADYIQARELVFAAMQVASPLGQGLLQGVNRHLLEQRLAELQKR